jgi:hypothetical protein
MGIETAASASMRQRRCLGSAHGELADGDVVSMHRVPCVGPEWRFRLSAAGVSRTGTPALGLGHNRALATRRCARAVQVAAGLDPRPASGDEQERHSVMAETCFATNAGIRPSMPTTIAIRPFRASDHETRSRSLAARRSSHGCPR